ncbi:hypothetical protein QUB08_17270, partial [Microcoleus sp. BR0-C5]|uniref:hypothetical protein n=1 Tax=Microcoleus sp. BR0-C5 TaxID=2818713 RepID=UPI002FD65A95
EGRRKKEEGRRKKEEGRRKKEEGRRKKFSFPGYTWKRIYRVSASSFLIGGRARVKFIPWQSQGTR